MNWLRGNTRRHLLGSLSGAAPAAASFLGIKVGRGVILRVSALLALRTVLSSVQLPLDSGVVSYFWSFLFTSVQASMAVAAAASFLDIGGILGVLRGRLFGSASDTAFVALYGNLVMVVGPLCGLLEAAVITFEVMRISRLATDKMFAAEARGEGKLMRKLVFGAIAVCLALSLVIVFAVHQVYPGKPPLIMASVVIVMYTMCFVVENGHLLETAVLAFLSCVTLAIGLIEEFDSPTLMLDPLLVGSRGPPQPNMTLFHTTFSLKSAETRALLLLYTTSMLLVTMSRAPRFLRLVQIGAEALKIEEAAASAAPRSMMAAASDEGAVVGEGASTAPGVLPGPLSGIFNAVVLMAVTFRFLVWTAEVRSSEYLPVLCRAVQVVAMILLHRCFLGNDEGEEPQANVTAAEPPRDMAGNVIENLR